MQENTFSFSFLIRQCTSSFTRHAYVVNVISCLTWDEEDYVLYMY